jgi:hypothetical protein
MEKKLKLTRYQKIKREPIMILFVIPQGLKGILRWA